MRYIAFTQKFITSSEPEELRFLAVAADWVGAAFGTGLPHAVPSTLGQILLLLLLGSVEFLSR